MKQLYNLQSILRTIFFSMLFFIFSLSSLAKQCPVITDAPAQEICETDVSVGLQVFISGSYDSLLWEPYNFSATGAFDSETLENPVYTFGAGDGNYLEFKVTVFKNGCTPVFDTASVTRRSEPVVFAGDDAIICEGETIALTSASITNQQSGTLSWKRLSDGTDYNFDAPGSLNPTYTPDNTDIANETVTLRLTYQSDGTCQGTYFDDVTFTINPLPSFTISDYSLELCRANTTGVDLTAANIENATSYYWAVNTSLGTLNNAGSPTATFIPQTNTPSEVIATFTATNGCGTATSSDVVISLTEAPAINTVSYPDTVCENETSISVAATASEYDYVTWSGDNGETFDDNHALNTNYNISTDDLSKGYISITLTAYPNSPCVDADQQSFTIPIIALPVISAGSDAQMCYSSNYSLNGQITNENATSYSDISWSVPSGYGTLTGAHTLNPVYTPSSTAISNGSVTLTLSVTPTTYCNSGTPVTDEVVLEILKPEILSLPASQSVCSGNSFDFNTISGSVTVADADSNLWSGGSGSWSPSASQLLPEYTAVPAEISAGSVTLTLTAYNSVCPDASADDAAITLLFTEPVVDAGSDITICESAVGTVIQLSGGVDTTHCGSVEWSTNGNGTISGVNTIDATYTVAAADVGSQPITFTLKGYGIGDCSGIFVSDTKQLFIHSMPEANTNQLDTEICEDGTLSLSGSAVNADAWQWSSTYGITGFSDPSHLATVFTPDNDAISNGSTTITLTVQGQNGCASETDSDSFLLDITALPEGNAGNDDAVCGLIDYTLQPIGIVNEAGVEWTSTGNGTFDNPTLKQATYTPDASDLGKTLVFTLKVYGQNSCGDVSDDVNITFDALPQANAGTYGRICSNETIILNGSASYYASVAWSGSNGTGGFSATDILGPDYAPTPADIADGQAQLTLTAYGQGACSAQTDVSTTAFNISAEPEGNAGANDEVCGTTNSYTLQPQGVSNYDHVYWSKNGYGSIIDPTVLNAVYEPDPADEGQSVQFTLEIFGNSPCGDISSDVSVIFTATPEADAGPDFSMCETDPDGYPLSGTASNFSSVQWFTVGSGTGTFANGNSLNATFFPSQTGTIQIYLQANPNGSCTTPARDTLTVTVDPQPSLTLAAVNTDVCEGTSATLNANATNYSSYTWTTTGTGAFSQLDPSTPTLYSMNESAQVSLTIVGANTCASEQVTETVSLNLILEPTADAGSDGVTCVSDAFLLNGTVTDEASVEWTVISGNTSGIGNATILNTDYTPAPSDAGNTVRIELTAYAQSPCTTNATDEILIDVVPEPDIETGGNNAVCETNYYDFTGHAVDNSGSYPSGYSTSYSWAAPAIGVFSNHNILTPIYYPPDVANEQVVTLTLTGSNGACSTPDNSSMNLTIYAQPEVQIDGSPTVCVSESVDVLAEGITVSVANSSTGNWTWVDATSGVSTTGTFSSSHQEATVFTPSAEEIALGYAYIGIEANGDGACSAETDADYTYVYFEEIPTIDIVEVYDNHTDTICDTETYTIPPLSGSFTSVVWDDGNTDGSFIPDANTEQPVFQPGPGNINTGSVRLTVTASGNNCPGEATDYVDLIIEPGPMVNAGPDLDACEGVGVQLESVLSHVNTITWHSPNGTGSFSDIHAPQPVFTPNHSDAQLGTIQLVVEGSGSSPCDITLRDTMLLNISPEVIVSAGVDTTICGLSGNVYNIAASSLNISESLTNINWASSGDGSFSGSTLLHPIYMPGPTDISNGSVNLTVNASAVGACLTPSSDVMTLSLANMPEVNINPASATICTDADYTMTSDIDILNYTSVHWTTSGDGYFNDENILNPVYSPGLTDIINATPIYLKIRVFGENQCLTESVTDSIQLQFESQPVANAGSDASICAVDTYEIPAGSASVSNTSNFFWATSGTQGTLMEYNTLTPRYTPSLSDVDAGSVVLTLYALPETPCDQTDSSKIIITIRKEPVAYAGPDVTICEGLSYTIPPSSNDSVANESSMYWTALGIAGSGGNGTITNAGTLTPTYYPTEEDYTNGRVILQLHATPMTPCSDEAVDEMTLTFRPLPVVDAGADMTICENDTYLTTGAVQNSTNHLWSTSGDGSFEDATMAETIYTPGPNDVAVGQVQLTLSAVSNTTCDTTITDQMLLTIEAIPEAYAGATDTVCSSMSNYSITDASLTGSGTISWSSGSLGTFINGTTLTPIYQISETDRENGEVVLTMTVTSGGTCGATVSSEKILRFQPEPEVMAGMDADICEDDVYSLGNGTAVSNYSSFYWEVSNGFGVLNNVHSLNAQYTPDANDVGHTVTLNLIAQPLSPCADTAMDQIQLQVFAQPAVNAGPDLTRCGSNAVPVSGASASDYTSLQWISNGSGIFGDDTELHPIYYPSTTDLNNDSVTLTLRAYGHNACGTGNYAEDSFVLYLKEQVEAYAGADRTVCEDASLTITDASVTGLEYSGVLWTTTGDGILNNTGTLSPDYTIVETDQDSVLLFLHVYANAPCNDAYDTMKISIRELPEVSVMETDITCSNQSSYQINNVAVTGNYSGIQWVSQSGGTFSNDAIEAPLYFPTATDIANGSVELMLSATATSPCNSSVADTLLLQFEAPPEVSATASQINVCEVENVPVSVAASNYTTISWSHSGGGSFTNSNSLTNTYQPIQADVDAGSVTITVTAAGNAPCESVTDEILILFNADPVVDAGADGHICTGDTYTLSDAAITGDYSTLEWQTNGDGTFSDNGILHPQYIPAGQDLVTNTVVLSLHVTGQGACNSDITDAMVLTLNSRPQVDAGIDFTVCEGNNVLLSPDNLADYSQVLWSTNNGTGTFDDETSASTTYFPTTEDFITGSITFTLTAWGSGDCSSSTVSDNVVVTLIPQPIITFTENQYEVCENDVFTFPASEVTVLNSSDYVWATNGTGILSNITTLTPSYEPDAGETTVTLTLNADADDPCTSTVSESITLDIIQIPDVEAGADAVLCQGVDVDYLVTDAAITNGSYASFAWSTNGSGVLSDATTLTPAYTPSAGDFQAGSVRLTLTVQNNLDCGGEVVDFSTLTLIPSASVEAGNDATICETSSYTVPDAEIVDYANFYWTLSGDGTLDNPTSENPTYIPNDAAAAAGFVILTLTAESGEPCGVPVSDQLTINIQQSPTANAGLDAEVCEGQVHQLNGAADNYSFFSWSSTGTGSFTSAGTLTPKYIPSSDDFAAGSVDITLTASAISPCSANASSTLTLDLVPAPVVAAGNDTTICEDQSLAIYASASNYGSISWSGGDGTFSNNSLSPVYTPGSNDILTGSVKLVLNATSSSGGCPNTSTDTLVLQIQNYPEIDAGDDAVLCEGSSFTATTASASGYAAVNWTTNGDGTFVNSDVVNAIYQPGPNDISNQSVILTMHGIPESPCAGEVVNQMTLNILPAPIASAGPDFETCANNSFTLNNASAEHAMNILWTSSGNGTFQDASVEKPTYLPSEDDISQGMVVLTMTVTGTAGCAGPDVDQVTVMLDAPPVAFAGADVTVCSSSYTVDDATASSYLNLLWTASGSGNLTNVNGLHPTYVPSTGDYNNGGLVTLTLTAFGNGSCASSEIVDSKEIIFNHQPVANAGLDETICEDEVMNLSGNASYHNSVTWETSGDGNFDDPTLSNAVYYPGSQDISNGTVTLTFTAFSGQPCNVSDTDDLMLTIIEKPNVYAGSDLTVCGFDPIPVTDASASDYSLIEWEIIQGGGTLANINTMLPTYTPVASDDEVILKLTAIPVSPCADNITDTKTIVLQESPDAVAGEDGIICENQTFTTSGAASNYSSLNWTTSGSGSFTNQNSLSATYSPSQTDIASGTVTLTLHASGLSPCSTEAVSQLLLEINALPDVMAGNDTTIALGNNILISDAVATNYSTLSWSTSGSGTWDNVGTPHPTYTPSAADYSNGSVVLTLTATSNVPCSGTVSDDLLVTFVKGPLADAGPDGDVCQGNNFTVSGAYAENYSQLQWSHGGDGALSNATSLTPTYYPATNDYGDTVVLTLTVTGLAPDYLVTADQMKLAVHPLPTADAGNDAAICHLDGSYTINTASANDYTQITWTRSGTGNLYNANTMNPTYIPSETDIQNGSVVLTLTAEGATACSQTVSDYMVLTIESSATVNAGLDHSICQGGTISLNDASASGYSAVFWTSSGSGTFSNNELVSPTYSPSDEDVVNGSVNLILHGVSQAPCADTVSDQMTLTISTTPTAYAGPNVTICNGENYTLSDAIATNYSFIQWSSNGSGSFSDANAVNPTYMPSLDDYNNGSVVLTFMLVGTSSCPGTYTDDMELSFVSAPTVSAGMDGNICVDSSFTVNGSGLADYSDFSWSHNGSGQLVNETSLTPTYLPEDSDVADSPLILTLTANGLDQCSAIVSDAILLSVTGNPVINAGPDSTICGVQSFEFVNASASGYSAISWSHTGTGQLINPTTPNPVYIPSSADMQVGNVVFTMTAQPQSPCGNVVTDIMVLDLAPGPDIYAGADTMVCENNAIYLQEATGSNYSSVNWTTVSGDGYFDNPALLRPTYTPGPNDILNGQIILRIVAQPQSPCTETVQDQIIINLSPLPDVQAGYDGAVCETGDFQIQGAQITNYSSYSWSTTGDGLFSNVNTLSPSYSPGPDDATAGTVGLVLRANAVSPCSQAVRDTLYLTVESLPQVFAGNNTIVCEGNSYEISDATASDYLALQWASNGSGSFENPSELNAVYHPSQEDLNNGVVTLTLSAEALALCDTIVTDVVELSFQPAPSLSLADSMMVCATEGADFSSVEGQNYVIVQWLTDGDGVFDDNSVLHTKYTPGINDLANDSTWLHVILTPVGPCVEPLEDSIELIYSPAPVVFAGIDTTICFSEAYNAASSQATDVASVNWTSSGSGVFDDSTSLHPVYTPSAADVMLGAVTLYMTGNPVTPCQDVVVDSLLVTFDPGPDFDAGGNYSVCAYDSITLMEATATGVSGYQWTTNGDGSFSDATALNPIYTPGSQDIALRSAELYLSVDGSTPCEGTFIDTAYLTIHPLPTMYAGADTVVCTNQFSLEGSLASDYSSLYWETSGGGSFVDNSLLHPVYQAGSGDIAAGSVSLTINGIGLNSCNDTISDIVTVIINEPIVMNAGNDTLICEGNVLSLNGSVINASAWHWETSGTGWFTDFEELHSDYIPSQADVTAGQVTLSLYAEGEAGCANVHDELVLSLQPHAESLAGNDTTVCEGPLLLEGATAQFQSHVLWSSTGTGHFSDSTIVEPIYYPSEQDVSDGSVLLTLKSYDLGPCADSTEDTRIVNLVPLPEVYAGVDTTICETNSYQLTDVSVSNYSALTWTTSGTGSFSNNGVPMPVYMPSAEDIQAGVVVLYLTAEGASVCNTTETDNLVLWINEQPEVDAGSDAVICENSQFPVYDAAASNYDSVYWTSSGSGSFVNNNSLTPIYNPGPGDETVTLTLTAVANEPCTGTFTDNMLLTIQPLPTVDAGPSFSVCQNEQIYVSNASAENYGTLTWYSNGTGYFIDNNLVNPTYVMSQADIANGMVRLTLDAESISPCGSTVSDYVDVAIQLNPVADAGTNATICENQTYIVAGASVQNASDNYWFTDGDGFLSGASSMSPSYTPAGNDVSNGYVNLYLVAEASAPCAISDTSSMTLFIKENPEAYAGTGGDICQSEPFTITDATASGYSTLNWTTSGDGTFVNAHTLTPTYLAGTDDSNNGSVVLTLEAIPEIPCGDTAISSVILYLTPEAVVDAGPDIDICETSSATLSAAIVSNEESLLWATDGDGTFTNPNTINTTYNPGNSDIASGQVRLSVTAVSGNNCGTDTDDMMVYIYPAPVVTVTGSTEICEGTSYLDMITFENYAAVNWTTYGAGTLTNANTTTPIYTTDPVDVLNGQISFTATADAQAPCSAPVSRTILVDVNSVSSVNAGPDDIVCENAAYTLYGASASNYDSLVWLTSGTGSFSANHVVQPIYYPSDADVTAGQVTLTVRGTKVPCSFEEDEMILTLQHLPVVDAGADAQVCEDGTYEFSDAMVSHYETIQWSTSGDGIFINDTVVNAVYRPGTDDISNGFVTLALNAAGIAPCGGTVTDYVSLDVKKNPVVTVDNNATICESQTYTVHDAMVENYEILHWSTSGDGQFSNSSILSPEYIPGASDINAGQVTLSLEAINGPCAAGSDSFVLNIAPAPDVYAGSDAMIDESSVFDITEATVSHASSYQWYTTGTGTFLPDAATLNGSYDPSQFDYEQGGVTLYLIAQGQSPCGSVADSLFLTIASDPNLDFTYGDVCVGLPVSFHVHDSTDVNALSAFEWDFGDGTTSNQFEPSHVFDVAGTYLVALTVTDTVGYTTTVSHHVEANPLPTPYFEYSGPTCAGNEVFFTDHSNTVSGHVVTWHWDFGDGSDTTLHFPEQPDVSHVYANATTYDVILTIETSDGCPNTFTRPVMVVPEPEASFSYDETCAGQAVSFTDETALNGGSELNYWLWNFGDPESGSANTSELQNPGHVFTNPGDYEVTLLVENNTGCQDQVTYTVTIDSVPDVEFTFENTCEDVLTQFFADTSVIDEDAITQWLWHFGDGDVSNLENPEHLYEVAGSYEVTLFIEDTNGCSNEISHIIDVYPSPFAQFDFNEQTCASNPVSFFDYSYSEAGYIVEWHWQFGDGNDTTVVFPDNQNVTHEYATDGNYDVVLTITNSNGCTDNLTKNLTVEPVPIVNFDHSPACLDNEVQFEDLTQTNGAGDILSWHWDFGDPLSGTSNNSVVQNPVHVYDTPGIYYVTLTVESANSCSNSFTDSLEVSATTEVDFNYIIGCLGDTTFFNSGNFVDTLAISEWFWDFGDGDFADVMNPNHVYQNAGTFDVVLTITDTSGCVNSMMQQLQIDPPPLAQFEASANNCSNEVVLFTDASVASENGMLTQWHWDFGDGNDTIIDYPDIPDISHLYGQSGNYQVTLTVMDSLGCVDDTTMVIQIMEAPLAAFSFDGHCSNEMVSFTDETTQNGSAIINSWYWNFDDPPSGDNNTSTLQNPVHSFTVADTFNVMQIVGNTNGCYDTVYHEVPVNEPPAVAIQAEDHICVGTETTFRPDTSIVDTAAIAGYDWYFGDGSPHLYNLEVSHIYQATGNYNVILVVEDTSGCFNEATFTVGVEETPVATFSYTMACQGSATQFTDHSYTNQGAQITSWQWYFDDPYADSLANYSDEQHPSHIFTVDSTYQVKLVVETLYGCSDSITIPVSINPTPEALFTFDTTSCQSTDVSFIDQSSSASSIIGWNWEFVSGYHSNLQNPEYVFPEADSCYDVSLIVTDAIGCMDTTIQSVCIPEAFEADFSMSSTCFGDTTYFDSYLVAPVYDSIIAVDWNFGDPASGAANISDQFDPYHFYEQPGTYNVTMTATNSNFCSYVVNQALQVHALPEVNFTSQSYPCDSSVYFNDLTTTQGEIMQWIWHWGDGTENDTIENGENPDIAHQYENAGYYDVMLEVVNAAGCYNALTKSVFREPCVSANFALLTDTLCMNGTISFSDSSQIQSMIDSWEWDFGDGSNLFSYSSYIPNITHTYRDTGSFIVKLTVRAIYEGQPRENVDSLRIMVNPTPSAQFSAEEVCEVNPMIFEDLTGTDSARIYSWRWDFGVETLEGDTSALQHPSYKYDTFGEYQVQLAVMNEYGCRDTVVNPVIVHNIPVAKFINDTSCIGDPTLFADATGETAFSGEIVEWYWDFGVVGMNGDTANIETPEYTYISTGTHQVELRVVDNYGCRDTVIQTVHTHPVPDTRFTLEEDYENMQGRFNLTNTTEGTITDYEWDFGNLPYHFDQELHQDNQNPVIVFENDGYYEIQLVTWNEFFCPDTATVADSLLFKGLFVPNAFSPGNPHAEVRQFKPAGMNLKSYHLQVYDVRGNLLWETTELDEDTGSPTEGWDGNYDGQPLPQGVYVWKIEAMFQDGTVWKGDEIGTSEKSSGQRYGTVTLIR